MKSVKHIPLAVFSLVVMLFVLLQACKKDITVPLPNEIYRGTIYPVCSDTVACPDWVGTGAVTVKFNPITESTLPLTLIFSYPPMDTIYAYMKGDSLIIPPNPRYPGYSGKGAMQNSMIGFVLTQSDGDGIGFFGIRQ